MTNQTTHKTRVRLSESGLNVTNDSLKSLLILTWPHTEAPPNQTSRWHDVKNPPSLTPPNHIQSIPIPPRPRNSRTSAFPRGHRDAHEYKHKRDGVSLVQRMLRTRDRCRSFYAGETLLKDLFCLFSSLSLSCSLSLWSGRKTAEAPSNPTHPFPPKVRRKKTCDECYIDRQHQGALRANSIQKPDTPPPSLLHTDTHTHS